MPQRTGAVSASHAAIGTLTGGPHGPNSPLALVQRAKYVAIMPRSADVNELVQTARVTSASKLARAGSVSEALLTARKRSIPVVPAGRARRVGEAWSLTRIVCDPCAIALTLFAWRRDAAARRRTLHNHCPACGYDRAGLATPTAVCPECGEPAPTAVRP